MGSGYPSNLEYVNVAMGQVLLRLPSLAALPEGIITEDLGFEWVQVDERTD
jgi:hypothetical protein